MGRIWGGVCRWAVVCVFCACVGTLSCAAAAAASSGELSPTLVVAGSPMEAEQRKAEEGAWLASPEGVREREESQTKFENLKAPEAQALAGSDISSVLQTPEGGPPTLPEGQRVVGFLSPYAAQVDLGEGERDNGLVESFAPMAVETSKGQWAAVDMHPRSTGGGFEESRGLVRARLPARLGEGVQLPCLGITVTPVDGDGSARSGEGVVDGASVFYANSQADTDTIMKLSTF